MENFIFCAVLASKPNKPPALERKFMMNTLVEISAQLKTEH